MGHRRSTVALTPSFVVAFSYLLSKTRVAEKAAPTEKGDLTSGYVGVHTLKINQKIVALPF